MSRLLSRTIQKTSVPRIGGASLFVIIPIIVGLLAPINTAAQTFSCSLLKPPTTPTELLQNLLCLTKNSTKVEDSFFIDDEKLWQLTAGQSFARDYPLTPKVYATFVTHFPMNLDSSTGPWSERLNIQFLKIHSPFDLQIQVHNANVLNLNFEDIEKIFGTNWGKKPSQFTIEEPFNPPPPKMADINGNKEIRYKIALSPAGSATIDINFDPKGICERVDIEIKEIKHD